LHYAFPSWSLGRREKRLALTKEVAPTGCITKKADRVRFFII
jgi:hypothetical protein